ncbi:MAG: AAA family ATPase [Candidatus Thorarchaeota archaeon]
MRLDEKYRPKALSDIVGQDKAVKIIGRLSVNGIGGRAYWLTGQSGTGKTTIARILASQIADRLYTKEIVGRQVTPSILADFKNQWPYSTMYGNGYALIINEAHGLTKPVIEIFLDLLENLPANVIIIFTTTNDGQDLFEEHIDASPFASRCIAIQLARRNLAEPFARRLREIAQAEGLDGQPDSEYMKLLRKHNNNFRACLMDIEAGAMIGD